MRRSARAASRPSDRGAMSEVLLQSMSDEGICTLTLNRPDRLNAFNPDLEEALADALSDIGADDGVRVVILHGAGRAFSAGIDIGGSGEPLTTTAQWRAHLEAEVRLVYRIWDLPQPVIASVHGYCLGFACDLAMAADTVVCAEGTRFGEPEIKYSSASTFLILPYLLGLRCTKDLLLTGDLVEADEALRMGLVSAVVGGDELETETQRRAVRMARLPQEALRLNKRSLNHAFEAMGLRQAVHFNLEMILQALVSDEAQAFRREVSEKGLKAVIAAREEGIPGAT
jgi:enoyl-CoA hydratase/carnithine racemase